jgi:transposase
MPALVAMPFNPYLKAKYHRLPHHGKGPQAGHHPVMRKLAVLANALLKANPT